MSCTLARLAPKRRGAPSPPISSGGSEERRLHPRALMDRLTNGDLGQFWAEGPTSPMQIAVAAVLSPGSLVDLHGAFVFARARDRIARRLDRAPSLRRRVAWPRLGQGGPLWIDDEAFDLDRHVQLVPSPGPLTEAAFLDVCAREAVRPLDRCRPLWRICFMPELEGRNVGMLVVVHHALADGLRGVALLGALLDVTCSPSDGETPPRWTPTRAPSASALVRDNVGRHLRSVVRAARGLVGLPAYIRRAWGPTLASIASVRGSVSRTPLSGEIGATRRLLVVRRPLAPLRAAGHRRGVSLNDLVLSAVTRGLGEWMRARGADVEGARIRVSLPVGATARNGNSVMLVPLPVAERDGCARLAAIARLTREAKARIAAAGGVEWSAPRAPRFVAKAWIRALRRFGRRRVTAYVTNVPGPAFPLWLGDARLLTAAPISPLVAGVTLSIAILSYDGALSVSIHVDGAVPGVEAIADGLASELDAFTAGPAPARIG